MISLVPPLVYKTAKKLNYLALRARTFQYLCIIIVFFLNTIFLVAQAPKSFDVKITSPAENNRFCKGIPENFILIAETVGGTPPFVYEWTFSWNNDTIRNDLINVRPDKSGVVTLTVKDNSQYINIKSVNYIIHEISIAADFTSNPDYACAQNLVKFNTVVSGGTPNYSYSWNFGDGKSSNILDPTHEYIASGCSGLSTFNVRMSVVDDDGCTSYVDKTITVKNKPFLNFADIKNPSSPFKKCSEIIIDSTFAIILDNRSLDTQCISSYNIDWGDGNNENNVSFPIMHTYKQIGAFKLVVTAVNTSGCDLVWTQYVYIQSNPGNGISMLPGTSGCAPWEYSFILHGFENNSIGTTYTWDFGDGSPLVVWDHNKPHVNNTITHVYTKSPCENNYSRYFVTSVIAENGCYSKPATLGGMVVWTKPDASIDTGDTPIDTICLNETIVLENNSVRGYFNDCNTPSQVEWDFGNGNTSNEWEMLPMSWSVPGEYDIVLTLSNDCGSSKDTFNIFVLGPPVSDVVVDDTEGCAPFMPKFENKSTVSEQYLWNISPNTGFTFMNGTNEKSSEPEIRFYMAGSYRVVFYAINKCNKDSVVFNFNVFTKPEGSIKTLSNVCITDPVIHPSLEYKDNGSPVNVFNWTFTGGIPSTASSEDPGVHAYAAAGKYQVNVVLENLCGSTPLADTFYVHPTPQVTVNTPVSICESDNLVITNTIISNATSFWWERLGNGFFNNNFTLNPIYTPGSNDLKNLGSDLRLIAQGIYPCKSDTATVTLSIQKQPVVWVEEDITICEGQEYIIRQARAESYDFLEWTSSGDGHFSDPGILLPIFYPGNNNLSAGYAELTLRAQAINPCTQNVFDKFIITFAKVPTIDAGPDRDICENGQIQLNASGTGFTSVHWQVESGSGNFSDPASINPVFKINSGFTDSQVMLTIEASGGFGCTNVYDTLMLSVIRLPIVSAGDDAQVCESGWHEVRGASLQEFSDYFWTVNGDGSLNNNSILNPLYTPGISDINRGWGSITLQAKGNSVCPDVSDDIRIDIQKLPESYAGEDQNVCKSNNYITEGRQENGASYRWTPLGTGTFGNDTELITNYYPSDLDKTNGTVELVFTVNAMAPCMLPDQDTVKLTFIDPPEVFAGNDTTICSSFFVPIGAYSRNSTQFTWSSDGSGLWENKNTLKPVYYPSGTDITNRSVILRLTSTNPSCPEVSDYLVLNLTPSPVAEAGSDESICEDNFKYLVDSKSENYSSFKWSSSGDGYFDQDTVLHTFYIPGLTDIGKGSVKLYLTATGIPPCNTPKIDSLTLSIQKKPVVYAGGDTIIGEGEIFTAINARAGNVNQVVWSTPDGDGTFQNGSSIVSTYLPGKNDLLNKGVYLVIRGTSISPCANEVTDTIHFLITPKPIANAGADEKICEGSELTVSKATAEEYSEIWWTTTGTGVLENELSLNPTYKPSDQDISNRMVELTLHARGKNPIEYYVVRDTMRIEIIHNAFADVIPLDTTCENASYQIRDIIYKDVNSISWSSSGYGDFNGTGQENPVYSFSSDDRNKDTLYFYLEVTSLAPCNFVHKDTLMIRLYHEPEPAFNYDNPEGCAPLRVGFTNLSAGEELSYYWDFGSGLESTDENPGYIVFQQGRFADTTYTISLSATNRCNSFSTSRDVIVKPIPITQFGMNVSWGCSPKEILFYNITTGLADTYLWKWGDGKDPSTEEHPESHIFETGDFDTTYTITLIASNECGVDSLQKSVNIFPNTVEAFFETDTTMGCAPFKVSFTNYSRGVLGDKPFLNWSWNFGDGNITDELHPVHTFKKPGKYPVTLYVNDTCSYNSFTTEINVMGAPHVDFVTNKTDYCVHDTVFVTPVNMPLNEIASVIWDFGDLNKGFNFNDTHIYDTTGVFNIILTAKDVVNGCKSSASREINIHKSPLTAFSIPDNDACQPLQILFKNETEGGEYFAWDFGNGNISVDVNGQQVYTKPGTYDISLRATNIQGCSETAIRKLQVNPKPLAAFESSSLQTCFPPVDIEFFNLSEGANDFRWDFGNGRSSKDTNPIITYSEYGDYSINLVATNIYSCTDTSEMVYHVYHNPVADFTADTTIGCDPFTVPFNNLSEYGLEYYWDFEEQGGSGDEEPLFTFKGQGIYTVSLRVVGLGGCNDSIVKEDYITTNPSPVSDFEFLRIKEIDTIQFFNYSSGATSYLWNFGDGQTSEEENPWHRFNNYGTFNVGLTTTNEYNCKNTKETSIDFELYKGLFLPNAFAPENASEAVREFKAIGMGLIKYHLVVYDTWGNLIWESTRLERGMPAEAWDGTLNGKPLHPDVYVWHLKEAIFKDGSSYDGKRYGSITLIK